MALSMSSGAKVVMLDTLEIAASLPGFSVQALESLSNGGQVMGRMGEQRLSVRFPSAATPRGSARQDSVEATAAVVAAPMMPAHRGRGCCWVKAIDLTPTEPSAPPLVLMADDSM